MAKDLNFVLGASKFAAAPVKLERKKLYGWTELRVQDPTAPSAGRRDWAATGRPSCRKAQ